MKLGNSSCCNASPAGWADGSTFKVNISAEFLCPNSLSAGHFECRPES